MKMKEIQKTIIFTNNNKEAIKMREDQLMDQEKGNPNKIFTIQIIITISTKIKVIIL